MYFEERIEVDDLQPLTVIPDVNILIHGKSLRDLPWGELGHPTIEVMIVPPVVRELDKLKMQPGRSGRVAHRVVTDIRALINAPGRRADVRQSRPAVSIRVELRSFTKVLNAALRPDHADHALINYALHLRQDGTDVLLLTHDTICGTTAQEVGLATQFLPDHWLREPELDEVQKENATLRAEVQHLRNTEPRVQLTFRDRAGKPLKQLEASVTRWPALTDAEIDDLMAAVRQSCPQATSFGRQQPRTSQQPSGLFAAAEKLFGTLYDPPTEEEIERYQKVEYPNWLSSVRNVLASLHLRLDERTEWPTIVAVGTNVGTRPAMDTLFGIQIRGAVTIRNDSQDDGKAYDRPELPLPPAPPRGRAKLSDYLAATAAFASGPPLGRDILSRDISGLVSPQPRHSDAFYWRTGNRDWVNLIELECASWRHDQNEITVTLKVRPSGTVDAAGVMELSVHAQNLSDPMLKKLPIRLAFYDGPTLEEARALVEMLGQSVRGNVLV